MIRDMLTEEGQHTKKAYYLLEGHVNINASLSNGEMFVLSQVGK
jgi:CRP-like cAMP-binding protein